MTDRPRIPHPLNTWGELNRRAAGFSRYTMATLEDLEQRVSLLEAQSNTFSAPYTCEESDANPAIGAAAWRTSGDLIRVSNTDSVAYNWFSVFQTMVTTIVGGHLYADGLQWEITSVTQIGGQGNFHDFGITPVQAAPSAAIHEIVWEWP